MASGPRSGDGGDSVVEPDCVDSRRFKFEEAVSGTEAMKDLKERAFVDCMEAMTDLLSARQALGISMRSGFFNVARARYAMGPVRVGRLQYDSRDLCATTLVDIQESATLEDTADDGGARGSYPRFVMRYAEPNTAMVENQPSPDLEGVDHNIDSHDGQQQEDGLRQRKRQGAGTAASDGGDGGGDGGGTKGDLKVEEALEGATGGRREARAKTKASPLSWFGALVSPHLRSAKGDFTQALDYAVAVANAAARVDSSRARFMALEGDEATCEKELGPCVQSQTTAEALVDDDDESALERMSTSTSPISEAQSATEESGENGGPSAFEQSGDREKGGVRDDIEQEEKGFEMMITGGGVPHTPGKTGDDVDMLRTSVGGTTCIVDEIAKKYGL